jgi:hypothetical protein
MPAKSQYRAILDLLCRFKNESYFVRGVLTKNAHSCSESAFISKWRVACGYYWRWVAQRVTASISALQSRRLYKLPKIARASVPEACFFAINLGSPNRHLL